MIQRGEFSIFDFRFSIRSLNSPKVRHRARFSGPSLEWPEYLISIYAILVVTFSISACSKESTTTGELVQTANQSPYIAKVFDYQYGPGQHASLIASDEKGIAFVGEPWTNGKSFTFLGGWGGYIIAGFDHAVNNTNGPDIAVYTQPSVGSEAGVVYVMADTNKDGLPNDGPWLELKGSEYNNPETIHNYQVTYYKPGTSGYVTWKDNKGKVGNLVPGFGTESWWWGGYGDKTSVTFSGEKLPDAYANTSKDPSVPLWMPIGGLFRFGYAECYDNEDYNAKMKANFFDISTAVDAAGVSANLSKVNFIMVQSGVFQVAGWLNEVSTEISGAADIHLLDKKSY